MKKHALIHAAVLLPLSLLQAATWTVDNNTAHPADFRSIQAAIDAAAVGDTILVAGSAFDYSSFTSTKRLIIRGQRESATGRNVVTGGIQFTEFFDDTHPDHLRNAAGSVVEGIETGGLVDIMGPCSGILIDRCKFTSNDVRLYGCSGTVIRNCVVAGLDLNDSGAALNGRVFHGSGCNIIGCRINDSFVNSDIPNTLFENCVLGKYVGSASETTGPVYTSSGTAPFVIRNSILIGKTTIFSSPTSAYNSRVTFEHCLSVGGYTFPAGNGNVSIAYNQFANVFVDATPYASDPASFVLKAGSPAIGAGKDGVDMGMYGGLAPFVPNLVPALPRITKLTVPPLVPDAAGLTIEVEAEARD